MGTWRYPSWRYIDRITNHVVYFCQLSCSCNPPPPPPHLPKKAKKQKYSPPWNAHISCMRNSRSAHLTWVNAGRPSRDHPLSIECRDTKCLIRRTMPNRDKNVFHIIAKHRSHSTNVQNKLMSEILDAWADHFDSLGTLLEDSTFDANYRSQVLEDMKCIFHLASLVIHPLFPWMKSLLP